MGTSDNKENAERRKNLNVLQKLLEVSYITKTTSAAILMHIFMCMCSLKKKHSSGHDSVSPEIKEHRENH